ncbi:MAG: DinB family protein [Phycisphaerae bacterium]
MTVKKLLRYNIRLCHSVVTAYLADLSNEELLDAPASGANAVAWQLGHVLVSNEEMLRALGGSPPPLPPDFVSTHSRSAARSSTADQFAAKSEYLAYFAAQHEYALQFLEAYPENLLGEPGPEKTRAYLPTNAAVFLMLGTHEMMHAGQIAVLRRKLSKSIVI